MLALRKCRPAPGVSLMEIAEPRALLPGEVLISVQAAGVCGTDLHIADWTGGYEGLASAMPVTLGHEFAGTVVASAAPLGVGVRVVVRPSVTCGICASCREGQRDDCTNRRGIGLHRDGGFAARVIVPAANCILIPEGMTMDIAALAEPLSVCAQAIERSRMETGMRILILGPGPIGQGIAVLAHKRGAHGIVVVGKDDAARLAVVQKLAAVTAIDAGDGDLAATLKAHDETAPYDVIFEGTGRASVVSEALAFLKKRGTMVVVGIHGRPAEIALTALVRSEQAIVGSYRAPVPLWDTAIAFLGEHGETLRPMITHRLPLASAEHGFDLARLRKASKVMLLPALDS
jgi:threonine dehydrogenase-like Zn-dependent dehydrogenase